MWAVAISFNQIGLLVTVFQILFIYTFIVKYVQFYI